MDNGWDKLHKEVRNLEHEVGQKLISLSKIQYGSRDVFKNIEEAILCNERLFESQAVEIERLLRGLARIGDKLCDMTSHGNEVDDRRMFILQRHNEVLDEYTDGYQRIRQKFKTQQERETLLHSIRKDIHDYKDMCGLNRRVELYARESEHIRSSDRLIDEQITIAMGTREHLLNQRVYLKSLHDRVYDLTNRLPVIRSLINRIYNRKVRDSIILGVIIGLCTFIWVAIKL